QDRRARQGHRGLGHVLQDAVLQPGAPRPRHRPDGLRGGCGGRQPDRQRPADPPADPGALGGPIRDAPEHVHRSAQTMSTVDLLTVLKQAVDQKCSDIHLRVGKPPMMRKNGAIAPIDPSLSALDREAAQALIYSMLADDQRARFEEDWELDTSYEVRGLSRFRVTVLMSRNGVEAVLRVIGADIPAPESIG